MESIWRKETKIEERKPLKESKKAEVVVIGAGMAGLLTAYFLKKEGVKVLVLEKDRIAGGQTQNTTAKITAQHGLIYDWLIGKLGQEKAQLYADANKSAIENYERIIREENISCQFTRLPAYLYATKDMEPLKRELEAAKKLGIEASITEATTLPFHTLGALKFEEQAQFQPLEFINAIQKELVICEQTGVKSVEDHEITTDWGSVKADKIVVATHFPFINSPGYYFMRMHQERSYVIALKTNENLDGMYYGIDEDGVSLRRAGDVLLLGGGNHRTGENKEGGRYDMLRKKAAQWYPDAPEAAHWSAQDCMTLDKVPYIGQYSASTPDLYVATGFQKWGMTNSMISAMLLTDLILGRKNDWEELYTPQRFEMSASAKSLMEEGLHSVKGIAKEFLQIPKKDLEQLECGHGGIIEWGLNKAGVYKDENGVVYTVSTKCPHLGCQLEWNPDELSWDCPCHGSRFSYDGSLIDNPAMHGIEV